MLRHRSLVLALIAVGAVACGRSNADQPRLPEQAESASPTRDLQLMEAPAPTEAPAVSDLEAGRTEAVHRAHSSPAPQTAVAKTDLSAPEVTEVITAPAPAVVEAAAPTALVEAPAAAAEEPAPRIERAPPMATWMGGSDEPMAASTGFDSGLRGAVGGHGPVIIIRGGRGGIHDDCDLDRPRNRIPGHGIAINQRGSFPGRAMPRGIR